MERVAILIVREKKVAWRAQGRPVAVHRYGCVLEACGRGRYE